MDPKILKKWEDTGLLDRLHGETKEKCAEQLEKCQQWMVLYESPLSKYMLPIVRRIVGISPLIEIDFGELFEMGETVFQAIDDGKIVAVNGLDPEVEIATILSENYVESKGISMHRQMNRHGFLHDLVEVCKRYNLSLAHEDVQGAFVVEEYKEENINWLLEAQLSRRMGEEERGS